MSTNPAPIQPSPKAPTPPGGPSAGASLMHGHLLTEPKSFWADVWSQVLRRPAAVAGLAFVGFVTLLAVFAPLIANGHPYIMWTLSETGERLSRSSPLIRNLSAVDVALILGGMLVPIWLLLPSKNVQFERWFKILLSAAAFGLFAAFAVRFGSTFSIESENETLQWLGLMAFRSSTWFGLFVFLGSVAILFNVFRGESKRSTRMLACFYLSIQAGLTIFLAERVAMAAARPDAGDWLRDLEQRASFVPVAGALVAGVVALIFLFVPLAQQKALRAVLVFAVAIVSGLIVSNWWLPPPSVFDYQDRVAAGQIEAVYAPIPFSPHQRRLELDLLPPGSTQLDSRKFIADRGADAPAGPMFVLGTDGQGQDVLSQLIHACRLSISIGLVSTGIAVIIGVTMGALMGYFGGWVDLLLYRVVEIFMAIPVLFLLIVAAAVLPRNIYVMMAIIGCVTWTGAARFTRAEFYKLRGQDFVQAAKALGLPLRSILFRHMLPNGVTPVLVDASFAIAAAILFEAVLSFLLLGPTDQPSWGRLLAGAFNDVGEFKSWIAIYPGMAIFLTVLSLTLVGEALRDAIDPKLKKAAH